MPKEATHPLLEVCSAAIFWTLALVLLWLS